MFILGPAFTLYVIGVVVNNKTWRIVTGCCPAPNGCIEFCRPRKACFGGCFGLFEVSFQALVGAISWIFIAFMSAVYYACAVSTLPCKEEEDTPELNESDKALSQSIGWCILAGSSLLLFLLMFMWRMCSSYTYEHGRYADIYADIERQAFIDKSKEDAEKRVKKTLEMFFNQEDLKCKDAKSWEDVYKAWSKISLVGSNYMADYGYTTLHEWAIKQGMWPDDDDEPDQNKMEGRDGNRNDMIEMKPTLPGVVENQ
ncbi:calcium homeostasis modulator protein 5-like [Ptychodera flava]